MSGPFECIECINDASLGTLSESMFFKNFSNPSCIYFLANSVLSFQHTLAVSCGLLDFHELVMTVLKSKPNHVR